MTKTAPASSSAPVSETLSGEEGGSQTIAFKLRLRPTPQQEMVLAANSIYSRAAYNWAVALSDFAWLVKRTCAEAYIGKAYKDSTQEERVEFFTASKKFKEYLRAFSREDLQKLIENVSVAILAQTEYVNKENATVIKAGERARHMKFLGYFREGLVRNDLIDGETIYSTDKELAVVGRMFDVMYGDTKPYPGFGGNKGSEAYLWVAWKDAEGNWDFARTIYTNVYREALQDFKRGQGNTGEIGKKTKTSAGKYIRAIAKKRTDTPSFGLPDGVSIPVTQSPTKNIVLNMPRVLGRMNTNRSWKKLVDIINDGGSIGLTRIYSDGAGWWAALFVTVPEDKTEKYLARKRYKHAKDVVGVDRGARGHNLVTVSQPLPPIVTGDGRTVISQKNGNIGEYKMSKKTYDRLLAMKRALSRKQDAREQRYQAACTQAHQEGTPRPRKPAPSGEENALLRKIRRIETVELASKRGSMHQISSYLVKNAEVVGIETLNIDGMRRKPKPKPQLNDAGEPVVDANGNPVYARNGRAAKRGLARVVSNASMGEVATMATYKAKQADGGEETGVAKIDQFYASSQYCSQCNDEVKVNVGSSETYTCAAGHTMNRDLNAARNIEKEIRRIIAAR